LANSPSRRGWYRSFRARARRVPPSGFFTVPKFTSPPPQTKLQPQRQGGFARCFLDNGDVRNALATAPARWVEATSHDIQWGWNQPRPRVPALGNSIQIHDSKTAGEDQPVSRQYGQQSRSCVLGARRKISRRRRRSKHAVKGQPARPDTPRESWWRPVRRAGPRLGGGGGSSSRRSRSSGRTIPAATCDSARSIPGHRDLRRMRARSSIAARRARGPPRGVEQRRLRVRSAKGFEPVLAASSSALGGGCEWTAR